MKTSREDKTPIQALSALHESASLRAVTGPSLRPGGFLLTDRGLSRCGFAPGARIADVGCGTGASVSYLRERYQLKAMGFDLSGELIRNNECAKAIPFAEARCEALPLADGCCDGVLCECVLSLVPEPAQAVAEFSRVLRNSGFLILSDIYDRAPIDGSFRPSAGTAGCASALRSRLFIEKLLGDSGFDFVAWEDHTRYLKELVAQLILNGDSCEEFRDLLRVLHSGCADPSEVRNSRPGYFLLVAQKSTKGETFHG
ncbi:MAG TPA: class I SAM-dependent methyltransferase [Geobacteraceae bacterium]|nr:class I SAM-dependent methyltransferase [Geobacteraceae bacterium]